MHAGAMIEPNATPAASTVAGAARDGIHAERWRACSAMLSEARRLRAFAGDLRVAAGELDVDGKAAAAVDAFVSWLDAAAARGDVAADLVLRCAD
ncbi:MAG: hypothetical protein JWN72_91 [Thermoleophilia bacterium]|nr:hypothetical protein [Thermoleophilia bacterium]